MTSLLDLLNRVHDAPSTASQPAAPTDRGQAYAAAAVDAELARLAALPRPWLQGGSYWDSTTFEVACRLVEIGNATWNSYTVDGLMNRVRACAPADDRWGPREHEQKITSALRRVGTTTAVLPDSTDMPPLSVTVLDVPHPPTRTTIADSDGDPATDDPAARLAAWRAHQVAVKALELGILDDARTLHARQKAGPPAPFDAGTVTELLARPPEPPWRAQGILPADASTLLVAPRKTGKSTLILNWARCLLTGEPFLGRFPVRPTSGNIAILNFEVGAAQLARWAADTGVPPDRLLIVNLRGRRNPLAHPDDRAALAALLRAHNTEALAVDPFGRAYTGINQNDAGEVSAFLLDLDLFARVEVGATDLLLAAHAGWGGERTRGSSALEDWADSIITLTKTPDPDNPVRFLSAVGRDVDVDEDALAYDPATRLLKLTGAGSRKIASERSATQAVRQPVLGFVRANPGCSGRDIEAGVYGTATAIRVAMAGLVTDGDVVAMPSGRRGGGRAYTAVDRDVDAPQRTYGPAPLEGL